MSISKRKLASNRANAQKSSGPTSAAGKEKVSQNGVKHGLCGQFKVLPCESQAGYDDLLERYMRVEQPADDVERELVAKMVRHNQPPPRSRAVLAISAQIIELACRLLAEIKAAPFSGAPLRK
jgi:hypothetical protein